MYTVCLLLSMLHTSKSPTGMCDDDTLIAPVLLNKYAHILPLSENCCHQLGDRKAVWHQRQHCPLFNFLLGFTFLEKHRMLQIHWSEFAALNANHAALILTLMTRPKFRCLVFVFATKHQWGILREICSAKMPKCEWLWNVFQLHHLSTSEHWHVCDKRLSF